MTAPASIRRRLAAEQTGTTLVEVLVTLVVGGVVLGIPFLFLAHLFGDADQVQGRTQAASAAQTALGPLLTDLRSATTAAVTSSGGSATLVLQVPVRQAAPTAVTVPATTQVTWTCSADRFCTRQPAGGEAVRQLDHLRGIEVDVTYPGGGSVPTAAAPSPSYARVTASLYLTHTGSGRGDQRLTSAQDPGGRFVTITDGVALRNVA